MSFRQTPSAIGICNRALSRIMQSPIVSLDPPAPAGVASRECSLWYTKTVARLLEMHHWDLATKRADALALVENDRTGDWTIAYAAPDDMAFPVGFSMYGAGNGMQYYRGVAGLLAQRYGRRMFQVSGSRIYSHVAGPFDYVSYDVTEADFTEAFENIVELSLAAAIAVPITKNKKLEADLREQATTAMNMAITQNLNQGGMRYGDEPSERDWARGSFASDPQLPWDWRPGR